MSEIKVFSEIYNDLRDRSNKVLNELLLNKKPESLYKPGAYLIESGGKRLRPLLVLLSVKACGKDPELALNAASAVELLHNFTLVHDDIMDEADKRRGRPTLHKKYDLSTAILSGDSLLAIAYDALLNDCKINTKEIVHSFTTALIEVCEGQSFDKEFEHRDDVSIDEYLVMIKKKTAALLEMCCTVGALISGAEKEIVQRFASYGSNLGIAFQIQDDYLDIFGEEKELGKIPGGDIVQGKKTYLYLTACAKATNAEKAMLELLTHKKTSYDEVQFYREMYSNLGIPEDALRDIKFYSQKALDSLSFLNNEDKDLFTWLTNTLITRNK